MRRSALNFLLLGVTLFSGFGCDSGSGSKIEFVPVKGKVTIDGMPLTVGSVVLVPNKGTNEIGRAHV